MSVDLPRVSVIIPVRDDAAGLRACLAALRAQDYPAGLLEVIVVDNGSSPPVTQETVGEATLLAEPRHGSYAARNLGLRGATGEVVAFTDADCLPTPGWISAGVARLLADERTGLVAGGVDVRLPRDRRPRAVELYEAVHAFPQERYVSEHHFGVTANLFGRRETLEKVGRFDDMLLSGGDKDLGRRVHEAGYDVVFCASARVVHPPRSSWSAVRCKLDRVFAGELSARQGSGRDLGDVGRVTARDLLPPAGTIARNWSHPALGSVPRRVRYAGAACVARYLGTWAGFRQRRLAQARS